MTDNVQDEIKNIVDQNDVVLFMKGTKDQPQCGFSNAVVNTLSFMNVNYKDVNILESDELRQGIKDFTNWPTIPQLYIKGEFIGGCDIILDMHKSGELASVFDTKGINSAPKWFISKLSRVFLNKSCQSVFCEKTNT